MIYSLFEHQNLSLFLKLKKQFRQKWLFCHHSLASWLSFFCWT